MSSKHLWWGPFTSTFCEHCSQPLARVRRGSRCRLWKGLATLVHNFLVFRWSYLLHPGILNFILTYETIKLNLFIQKMYKSQNVQGVDLLARGLLKDYYLKILISIDVLLTIAS